MIDVKRRGFLFGGATFLVAPAIVRVASLMPLSVPKPFITAGFVPGEGYVFNGLDAFVSTERLAIINTFLAAEKASGCWVMTDCWLALPKETT